MYSIVETIERDEKLITAVPASWVKGHELYWPDKKIDVTKGRQMYISPESTWEKFKCRVLKENIGKHIEHFIVIILSVELV